jgi:hypothetical protein
MDVIFTHCAGLDVHKKSVAACRITPDATGQQVEGLVELKEFGTMTVGLLALSDWLTEAGITHVVAAKANMAVTVLMCALATAYRLQGEPEATGVSPLAGSAGVASSWSKTGTW